MSPARNAVFNSFGWLIPLVAYYLALPVILKAIGAEKFGLIVFAMTVVGYIGVVSPPISAGNIRFLAVAYGRGDRNSFITAALSGALLGTGIAVAAGGVLFFLAPFLADRAFASSPALRSEALMVFWLGCVGFIIGNLMGVATAIPAAMQRYGVINLCSGGGAALGLFLGAWRAEHTGSAISVVVGQVEGNAVALAVLILFNVRIMMTMGVSFKTVRGHSHAGIRELFTFSATLWLAQACSTISLQTDKFIVGLMTGPVVLAWYSIPAKVGEQFANAVGRVSTALYPLAGSHDGRDDHDSLIALYNAFLRLGLMLSATAALIARTHGPEILRFWIRVDLPANAGRILFIGVLTALFRTPGTIAYNVANGLGRAGITLLATVVGAAATALGVYLGAVHKGPVGAACGFLASAILTNLVFDGIVRVNLLGARPREWFDPYLRTFLTLIVGALASLALVADVRDSIRIVIIKACATVALSLLVGYSFGLLRIPDIRLLLQKECRVEKLPRECTEERSLCAALPCPFSEIRRL